MLNTDSAEAQRTQGIESVQVNLSYPFLQSSNEFQSEKLLKLGKGGANGIHENPGIAKIGLLQSWHSGGWRI